MSTAIAAALAIALGAVGGFCLSAWLESRRSRRTRGEGNPRVLYHLRRAAQIMRHDR